MPALNKDNIRGLVSFDRPEVLWEALGEGKGVVMLACHMDNWEWLGAALALNGFPLSAVEKPQPNHIYSDFMNELRTGVRSSVKWRRRRPALRIFRVSLTRRLCRYSLCARKAITGIRPLLRTPFTTKIPATAKPMIIR